VGIYLLYHLISTLLRRKWNLATKSVLWWSVMFVLAAMLSAVQLLPSTEFITLTSRSRPADSFVLDGSLPILNIVTAVLPEIFGSPMTYTAIQGINWGEHNLYIGAFPIVLVFMYLLHFRRHPGDGSSVYLVLAAVFLILAFGLNNPAYKLLFNYVPGFKQLADPGRMAMLYTFFLSVATAISLQHLADWLPRASDRVRALFRRSAIALLLLLVIALFMLTFGRGILSAIAEPLIRARYADAANDKIQLLSTLYLTQTITVFSFLCILAAGRYLIYYRMLSRLSAGAFAALSLLVIVVDIGIFAVRLTSSMRPLDTIRPPTYLAAFRDGSHTDRVLPLNSMVFINHGSRFGIPAVTGYNSLILSPYLKILGLIRGTPVDPADRVPLIQTYDSPLLKMLNVKYLVSYEPLQDPDLELLHEGDAYVYRMDVTHAVHAFMVYQAEYFDNTEQVAARMTEPSFDPMRSVLLEHLAPSSARHTEQTAPAREARVSVAGATLNSLTLDAYTSARGWLVVSEVYYPGWKAYVDGQETPIYKADLVLRAIELNPGHHTVLFVFDPDTIRYGLSITFAGMLLTVSLLLALPQLKKKTRPQHLSYKAHSGI